MGPVDVWFYCGAVGAQEAQRHRAAAKEKIRIRLRYIYDIFKVHSRYIQGLPAATQEGSKCASKQYVS